MKYDYITPVVEITTFDSEDIITTSNALTSLSLGMMDGGLEDDGSGINPLP